MNGKLMLASLTLLSAGCATQQQTAGLECGIGGAVGGYLVCKLAGGSDAACAGVAGGSGLLGGALCFSLSSTLEKHRKELAGHENELDARLRYLKAVNTDSTRYNEAMRNDIVKITQHTDTVVQRIQQKTIDQRTLAKERADLDVKLKNANDSLAAQQNAVNYMSSLQAGHRLRNPQLAQELQLQLALLDQTKQQTAALASQRQRI